MVNYIPEIHACKYLPIAQSLLVTGAARTQSDHNNFFLTEHIILHLIINSKTP